MNRSIIISVIVLAIIAALFWFFWPKSQEREPETAPRIVQMPPQINNEPSERRSFKFFDTIAPLVKPFEALIPSVDVSNNTPNITSVPQPQHENSTSAFDPLPASDPIFKKLYPNYYLEALKVTHLLMVNDGFLSDTSLDIPDENALFAFLSTAIDYAETKSFITRVDAERFRKALHGETRELLRKERFSFLNKILGYLNISNVFADIVTGPECYSDPYPFNIIPGVNLPFDYCCNCGLICPPVGPPVFVPDCSIKSCDVPLGCLNLICPNGNAIWDPLTGICGCDNPVSAAQNIPSILKSALNCVAPKQPAPPTPPPPPPPPPSTP